MGTKPETILFSKDELNEIQELLDTPNILIKDVAAKLNMTKNKLLYLQSKYKLKRNWRPRNSKPRTKDTETVIKNIEYIKYQIDNGKSYKELANELGVKDRTRISKYMNIYGYTKNKKLKLSDKQIDGINNMYFKWGKTKEEIAKILGISLNRLSHFMIKNKITKQRIYAYEKGECKFCTYCKQEKPKNKFGKIKKNKLRQICNECRSELRRIQRRKQKSRASKEWLEHQKELRKKYKPSQEARIKTRELRRRWEKEKKKTDVAFRLKGNMRGAIYATLKKGKNRRKTFDILGYSVEQLKKHLEKQFIDGMTWANYGEWQIDHIIPLSAFEIKSINDLQFKQAWALSNLRPLWKIDNIRKANKLIKSFQPMLNLEVAS